MKKTIFSIFTLLVILLMPSLSVIAADIDDALWKGIIRVSNNSSDASNTAVAMSLNSSAFIDNGFANEELRDLAILLNGIPKAMMPGYDANPWMFWVDSIGGGLSEDYDFYSGNVEDGKIVFFPDPSSDGLTIPYDSSLNLGNDFEIRINKVLPDTTAGVNKDIIYIEDSLRVYDSTTTDGLVTAYLFGTVPSNTNIVPIGAGSETNIPYVYGAATHWQAVATYTDAAAVYSLTNYYTRDLYAMSNPAVPANLRGAIHSVTLYYLVQNPNTSGVMELKPSIKTNGTVYDGSIIYVYYGAPSTKSLILSSNPVTGNPWTWGELDALEVGASILNTVSNGSYLYGVYAAINHSIPSCTSSLSNVSIDEKGSIALSINSTHLTFRMGESSNTTELNGAKFLDNLNDLIFFRNGSVFYAENITVSVGGTPISAWKWEPGDTFHDLIGTNHGTPAYRTEGSNPNVSAELISLSPAKETRLDTFTLTEITDFIKDVPEVPDKMYSELDFEHIPGADAVNEILEESETPQALWWFPFIYVGIILIGFMVYQLTTMSADSRQGAMLQTQNFDGSLLTMCIVMEVLMIAAGLLNPVPYWPAFLFPIPAVALILSRKHWSWG